MAKVIKVRLFKAQSAVPAPLNLAAIPLTLLAHLVYHKCWKRWTGKIEHGKAAKWTRKYMSDLTSHCSRLGGGGAQKGEAKHANNRADAQELELRARNRYLEAVKASARERQHNEQTLEKVSQRLGDLMIILGNDRDFKQRGSLGERSVSRSAGLHVSNQSSGDVAALVGSPSTGAFGSSETSLDGLALAIARIEARLERIENK